MSTCKSSVFSTTRFDELSELGEMIRECHYRSSQCCSELRELLRDTPEIELPAPVANIWATSLSDNLSDNFIVCLAGREGPDIMVFSPPANSKWAKKQKTPYAIVFSDESDEYAPKCDCDSPEEVATELRRLKDARPRS